MRIRDLSTKDVLTIIPLSDEIRAQLLDIYPDKVTLAESGKIEDLAWRIFYAYYDVVYEAVIKKHVQDNPGPLPDDYHDTMQQKTEELIMQRYEGDVTSAKLDELRKSLSTLIDTPT